MRTEPKICCAPERSAITRRLHSPTKLCPRACAITRARTLWIIDEFGFDRIERTECAPAAHLLHKIIASRNQKRSTALVTNVDFDESGEYLTDGRLAMAFLDRLVERAIVLKIKGQSYRADQAKGVGLR